VPRDGVLQVRMFSGNGVMLNNRRPDRHLRYLMLSLVLVEPVDLSIDAAFLPTEILHRADSISRQENLVFAAGSAEENEEDLQDGQGLDIVKPSGLERIKAHVGQHAKRANLRDVNAHLRDKTSITWSYK